MKDFVKDERFARITTDPRFRTVPKIQQKVKIDKRFKSMFTDERFKLRYTVDKRGRPIHTTTNESLRKYYELSESEEDDEESKAVSSSESDSGLPDGKLNLDLARGEGNVETSSSDDSSSEAEFDAVEVEHPWGEFDVNAPETQEITKRLAVCNVDWDRIKAQDLFILFNSFKPPGGVIYKISIYPSEFGLQRMKEEQVWGPPELRAADESKTKTIKNKETENTSEEEKSENTSEDEERKNTSDDEEIQSDSEDEEIKDNSEDEQKQDTSVDEETQDNSEDEETQDNSDDELHNNSGDEEMQVNSQDEESQDNSEVEAQCNSEDEEKQSNSEDEENQGNSEEEIAQNTSDSRESLDDSEDENDVYDATSDEEEVEDKPEEGNMLKTEKLRQYQLNRLKYYYGIVECDSPNTANTIYTECDGKEFEGSGVKMDLRFVPDDMEFDQIPKSEVTDLADPTAYKPANFISTALQQSKVNCTWDETDHDRLAVTMRKFNEEEVKENDLRAYLASSSDDEGTWPVASIFDKESNRPDKAEDDDNDDEKSQNGDDIEEQEEDILDKYKSLLKDIEEGEVNKYEKNMELQVTWEPGLKDVTKDLVKKKEENQSFTPWEQFLQKKKEKKKKKFDKKQQIEKSENAEKAMSDDDLPSDIDLNDSYFRDSFGPEFEKPKAKSKRKKKLKMVEKEETEEDQKAKAELELLVMEDDGRQHFNLEELLTVDKKKSKKNRKRKLMEEKEKKAMQDTFKVNVCDPRFEALYTSHMYHIDPSNPQFKKTKGMGDIIEEKLRRVTSSNKQNIEIGKETRPIETNQDSKKLKDLQLSLLVKSVKSAAQSLQKRKNR